MILELENKDVVAKISVLKSTLPFICWGEMKRSKHSYVGER